jgi:DNA-binding PadR family transcriptional regulator
MEQSMKPAWFHILVAIAAGHRHGYAIRQDVERRSDGRVRLWPATLYGALSDLVRAGLLVEGGGESADGADDPRRRCYALTDRGRSALEAELRQLEALVRAARVSVFGAGE